MCTKSKEECEKHYMKHFINNPLFASTLLNLKQAEEAQHNETAIPFHREYPQPAAHTQLPAWSLLCRNETSSLWRKARTTHTQLVFIPKRRAHSHGWLEQCRVFCAPYYIMRVSNIADYTFSGKRGVAEWSDIAISCWKPEVSAQPVKVVIQKSQQKPGCT